MGEAPGTRRRGGAETPSGAGMMTLQPSFAFRTSLPTAALRQSALG